MILGSVHDRECAANIVHGLRCAAAVSASAVGYLLEAQAVVSRVIIAVGEAILNAAGNRRRTAGFSNDDVIQSPALIG